MTVSTEIRFTGRGPVTESMRAYALDKVGRVVRASARPVLDSYVVLTKESDPARSCPAVAEACLDVDGTLVRGRVAAAEMREAVDLLEAVLRRRLEQLSERAQTRHRRIGTGEEHEWRHGDEPARRPEYYPLPVEQREVVRRTTVAAHPVTADEAARDMDLLRHRFCLFTDSATGQEAVVCTLPGGGYRLLGPAPDGAARGGASIRWLGPAVVRTDAEAIEHLDLAGEPFVFYVDAVSDRGRVLHRRDDGHYGLIVPA